MPATITPNRTNYYAERVIDDVAYGAGFYTDHRDADVQLAAFTLRQGGTTFPSIASALGLQTWDHAQAAVRAHARRTGVDAPVTRTRRQIVNHLLNRRYGVEIEFAQGRMRYCQDTRTTAQALVERGIDAVAESYNHATRSHWKVTTDATVNGCEVVSPILRGAEGWNQVKVVMEAIRSIGGTVDSTCGQHVHHDVTDFYTEAMVRLVSVLRRTQYALSGYVPVSRYNSGGACRGDLIREDEWAHIERCAVAGALRPGGDRSARESLAVSRYRFFNFNSVLTYGTVEFRAQGGTLNALKSRCWVAVGQALIEFARTGNTFDEPQSTRSMLDTLVAKGLLSSEMRTRFVKRVTALYGAARVEQVPSS